MVAAAAAEARKGGDRGDKAVSRRIAPHEYIGRGQAEGAASAQALQNIPLLASSALLGPLSPGEHSVVCCYHVDATNEQKKGCVSQKKHAELNTYLGCGVTVHDLTVIARGPLSSIKFCNPESAIDCKRKDPKMILKSGSVYVGARYGQQRRNKQMCRC